MSRYEQSLPAAYFDEMYASNPDPWRFASSPYEREKYAATLAALPKQRYRSALEIGCSIGVLTRQLADRCDALNSLDVAPAALEEARRRCDGLEHVRFDVMRVPEQWPGGRFDLILLSEVVYYLDRADVAALARRVGQSLVPDSDIVLVHWLGETHYPLSGDEAAELFIAELSGEITALTGVSARLKSPVWTTEYRLDVLEASGSS